MSEAANLSGPDLSDGVAVDTVPTGGVLLGRAGGEPVLLSRHGGELFAVGATCTHYSGPLAEGLVAGDEVHCPWHHACFSLRTGEALKAPALNPLPCWRVEVVEGRAFVRERQAAAAPAPRPGPSSVVIVGAGAAGCAAADMLRRLGYAGPVTLLTGEGLPPVDRPNLSKDYLAGTAREDWVSLREPDFFRAHAIELLPVRAKEVDVQRKRVELDDGRSLPYGAALLATGAEPVHLAIPGADLPHVHSLRSLADSRAIIAEAKTAGRVLVIGASFIGLEVAAALRTRGVEVDVVAPEARPLERVLGAAFGDFIRGLHEAHGVRFHLGRTTREIRRGRVILDDGSTLDADVVVVGVGVRPSLALAEGAGLKLDRGVVVDSQLETSVPGIFAAGDIARYPDPLSGEPLRVEHWVVAERQGQVAARNILGEKVPFREVPFFWSQHYDVSINYVGHAERWDRIEVVGSIPEKDCIAAYWSGQRIAAFASISRDRDSLVAESKLHSADAADVQRWWASLPRT